MAACFASSASDGTSSDLSLSRQALAIFLAFRLEMLAWFGLHLLQGGIQLSQLPRNSRSTSRFRGEPAWLHMTACNKRLSSQLQNKTYHLQRHCEPRSKTTADRSTLPSPVPRSLKTLSWLRSSLSETSLSTLAIRNTPVLAFKFTSFPILICPYYRNDASSRFPFYRQKGSCGTWG